MTIKIHMMNQSSYNPNATHCGKTLIEIKVRNLAYRWKDVTCKNCLKQRSKKNG